MNVRNELAVSAEFRDRRDLSQPMVEKMLSDNPRKLYGI
jgi:hypothetical protein